jgi:oxygen-independent coproporphyrinogen-3 oxidase
MFPHVYVHVPFCARRCTYCDFSIAVRRTVPVQFFLDALAAEVELAGDAAAARTLYLGGGTPSLLGAGGIAGLARVVRAPNAPELEEFTVEANPDDVTPENARAWRSAGVTRLSIGAQSFDPGVLSWMHRTHGAAAIGAAVAAARAAGIPSLSLDLIFALPEFLARDFCRDIASIVGLEPDHVSLYGLTVEHATPLGRQVRRGQIEPAPESRYEDDYLTALERLAAEGYRFYEVSNAARPGHESRHNSAYWSGASYLGLGPSAHSFDGSTRWWNEPAYTHWTRMLAQGKRPVTGRETMTPQQRELERLYLGLRTALGATLAAPSGARRATLESWVREGWAVVSETGKGALHVHLTASGWLRLDALVAAL